MNKCMQAKDIRYYILQASALGTSGSWIRQQEPEFALSRASHPSTVAIAGAIQLT